MAEFYVTSKINNFTTSNIIWSVCQVAMNGLSDSILKFGGVMN